MEVDKPLEDHFEQNSMNINQTPFIQKLYAMLEDDSLKQLIHWGPNEDSFFIHSGEDFSHVLCKYFRHTNIASFVRQLSMYGFHKVNQHSKHGLRNRNMNMDFKNVWEFKHDANAFKRHDYNSLRKIKRRPAAKSQAKFEQHVVISNSPNANSGNFKAPSYQQQQQLHQQHLQQQQIQQQHERQAEQGRRLQAEQIQEHQQQQADQMQQVEKMQQEQLQRVEHQEGQLQQMERQQRQAKEESRDVTQPQTPQQTSQQTPQQIPQLNEVQQPFPLVTLPLMVTHPPVQPLNLSEQGQQIAQPFAHPFALPPKTETELARFPALNPSGLNDPTNPSSLSNFSSLSQYRLPHMNIPPDFTTPARAMPRANRLERLNYAKNDDEASKDDSSMAVDAPTLSNGTTSNDEQTDDQSSSYSGESSNSSNSLNNSSAASSVSNPQRQQQKQKKQKKQKKQPEIIKQILTKQGEIQDVVKNLTVGLSQLTKQTSEMNDMVQVLLNDETRQDEKQPPKKFAANSVNSSSCTSSTGNQPSHASTTSTEYSNPPASINAYNDTDLKERRRQNGDRVRLWSLLN